MSDRTIEPFRCEDCGGELTPKQVQRRARFCSRRCKSARRVRRQKTPRPKTFSARSLKRLVTLNGGLEGLVENPPPLDDRDCPRSGPCPFVGCRFHLYLDVKPNGALTINFPNLEPWELDDPCALRRAREHEHTYDQIAPLINVSWQRVQMIAERALERAGRRSQQ